MGKTLTSKVTKKVLVADGNKIMKRLMESKLPPEYEIEGAYTQKEALEKLESTKYDMIILRNRLPMSDSESYEVSGVGLEILKGIREGDLNSETPTYLLTGSLDPQREKYILGYNAVGVQIPLELENFKDIFKC